MSITPPTTADIAHARHEAAHGADFLAQICAWLSAKIKASVEGLTPAERAAGELLAADLTRAGASALALIEATEKAA